MVLSKYFGLRENFDVWVDDRVIIVINDKENNFWSAILRLNDKEAKALVKAIKKVLLHRKLRRISQYIIEVGNDGKLKTNFGGGD